MRFVVTRVSGPHAFQLVVGTAEHASRINKPVTVEAPSRKALDRDLTRAACNFRVRDLAPEPVPAPPAKAPAAEASPPEAELEEPVHAPRPRRSGRA